MDETIVRLFQKRERRRSNLLIDLIIVLEIELSVKRRYCTMWRSKISINHLNHTSNTHTQSRTIYGLNVN